MFSVSGMRGAGKMRDPGNEVGNEESGSLTKWRRSCSKVFLSFPND